MMGTHQVMVYPGPTQTGEPVDVSCLVDQVSIQHGRDDTSGQPESSSCTLTVTTSHEDVLPAVVDVGCILTVTTQLPDLSTSTRFSGRVTDLALGWDEAGEATPDAGQGQIIAIGPLADLARRVVGDAPFPQELDGARVARIMQLAGMPLDPLTSDPGSVQILPRDIDSQAALDVAVEAAESAGGMLWQTKDGQVRYADSEHRRGTDFVLELDSCDVLVTPTWQRNLEGLINQVSIGYGPTPEEGEQPRYTAQSQLSLDTFGRYEYSLTTVLATLADAQALGGMLLARNAQPVWILSALPVDVKNLNLADTKTLLALDIHSLVKLTGLPAIGTAPTTVHLWVEGWTETLTWGGHDLELVVSGYCRTAPAPRWNDLTPDRTWDNQEETLTWDGASCLGPPDDLGRWDDIAATTRWDESGTGTWDEWKGDS